MDSVLEFHDVTKKYGSKLALNNLTISIPKGAIVGLLGPNGSGKTTMLKLTEGLLKPNSGNITVCGQSPCAKVKDLIAFQPDTVYLNNWMNVENLFFMLEDFYSNFNMEKAVDMLNRLRINPKERLKTLSKGTKEKVQLIATMSRDVPLYILDEPIGGVDPAARDFILNTIISNHTSNSTVIISTHLISDIENTLDYAVFIKDGQLIRQGSAVYIRQQEGKSLDAFFREEFRC